MVFQCASFVDAPFCLSANFSSAFYSVCDLHQYFIVKLSILSYIVLVVHFILENDLISLPSDYEYYRRVVIPRTIYALGLGKLLLWAGHSFCHKEKGLDCLTNLNCNTVIMFSSWSPTIILMSGSNGSFYAIMTIIGGEFYDFLEFVFVQNF